MADFRLLAENAKAWPFQEARALLKRVGATAPTEKGYVLFQTGYGPSGLPHIGTFGEVARTLMVRHAFEKLSDMPTRLFAFSDDMDGLRKVPDNVPKSEMVEKHLGKPLSAIPDPFGTHESYAAHNNAKLCRFLDKFGFEYEFKSATYCYKAGLFDEVLNKVLVNYDEVMNVILPTLGKERQATYSPFLPVCRKTGVVLQVPVIERDIETGTIVYRDEEGVLIETPITGGHCKLQWKADWAMRWAALGVDYEMSGKDLIDSVRLSSRICRILGGNPPVGFTYELFLDENGEKISKSVGNGLSVDEWLRYAPPESLAQFMFQKPKVAKRLYFDVIPRQVDDYLQHLSSYPEQDPSRQIENPSWHIHRGLPPLEKAYLSYNILLNLAGVCHTEDPAVLWHFISRYRPGASAATAPTLDKLVHYAITYYRDFIKPAKCYRIPNEQERDAIRDLAETLKELESGSDAERIQTEVYAVGKRNGFENLKNWFACLYEILLGQSQGPRMGSFIALYGIEETIGLIEKVLDGQKLMN
tara:strand:- start:494 stop:2080 length:1587 start_codon:yes stop_codon:yes gene_type:complete